MTRRLVVILCAGYPAQPNQAARSCGHGLGQVITAASGRMLHLITPPPDATNTHGHTAGGDFRIADLAAGSGDRELIGYCRDHGPIRLPVSEILANVQQSTGQHRLIRWAVYADDTRWDPDMPWWKVL